MTDLEILRRDHAALISEAATTVAVHRVTYVDDGAGGRIKQESEPSSFTGRLVPQGASRGAQVLFSEGGHAQLSGMVLLAPWDADLRAGSDVEDSFAANSRRYRVRRVTVRRLGADAYAVHAALEEVT